jgi:hypothetical protein
VRQFIWIRPSVLLTLHSNHVMNWAVPDMRMLWTWTVAAPRSGPCLKAWAPAW